MRAFVALELPEAFADEVAGLARRLEATCAGRFVPAENHHLTLAFLGEVGEARARRAMEQAWKHNRDYMETLAGHPLDSCPTAAEFVYLCARRVAWRCAEENSMT